MGPVKSLVLRYVLEYYLAAATRHVLSLRQALVVAGAISLLAVAPALVVSIILKCLESLG